MARVEPEAGLMVTPNVRLARRLGSGGMGSVWVADHLALHTQVVVKFMSVELAENAEALARFSREAAAASQVKSPHVVQTLDHGVTSTGVPYIVMELLEGSDLGTVLEQRGRLTPNEVCSIVTQLSRALGRAHEKGIVHRDIKPNNIFLCDAGGGETFVKLLDFGIAKAMDLPLLSSTTRTGAVVGSPYYMSPEQVVGAKTVDARTDLWSLGVVAFEALTGEKPFFAETLGGLALKIHNDPIPQPSRIDPSLSRAVDAWFARACARVPEERFASAKEMADALVGAVTGQEPPSRAAVESGRRSGDATLAFAATATPESNASSGARRPPEPVAALSETGAGMDLVVGERRAATPGRGRYAVAWMVGVTGLALGVGVTLVFALARTPKTPAEVAPSAAATASASAPLSSSGAPATAAAVAAGDRALAGDAGSLTLVADPGAAAAPAPPPVAASPAPRPSHRAGSRTRGVAATAPTAPSPTTTAKGPSPTTAASPPKPPAGSDDDIK